MDPPASTSASHDPHPPENRRLPLEGRPRVTRSGLAADPESKPAEFSQSTLLAFPSVCMPRMLEGSRPQKPHDVNVWVGQDGVIKVLSEWKAEEIDQPDRYKVVLKVFGDIKDVGVLVRTIEDFVKTAVAITTSADADNGSAVKRMRKRWAFCVRKLADAAPVPGANVGDKSKINTLWRYEASYCLLLTALTEIHRADPQSYFCNLLGSVPTKCKEVTSWSDFSDESSSEKGERTRGPARKKLKTVDGKAHARVEQDSSDEYLPESLRGKSSKSSKRPSCRSKTGGRAARKKLARAARRTTWIVKTVLRTPRKRAMRHRHSPAVSFAGTGHWWTRPVTTSLSS